MDAVGILATIVVPALAGLFGWAVLRQRGVGPALSTGAALLIALIVMVVAFIVIY